jgi:hypothetical protein
MSDVSKFYKITEKKFANMIKMMYLCTIKVNKNQIN